MQVPRTQLLVHLASCPSSILSSYFQMSESGPCSELMHQRVPLPLNPNILLEGVLPQECSCFKSAQLPIKVNFQVNAQPINWQAGAFPPDLRQQQQLQHPHSSVLSPNAHAAQAHAQAQAQAQALGPKPPQTLPPPVSDMPLPPVWQQRTSLLVQNAQLRSVGAAGSCHGVGVRSCSLIMQSKYNFQAPARTYAPAPLCTLPP